MCLSSSFLLCLILHSVDQFQSWSRPSRGNIHWTPILYHHRHQSVLCETCNLTFTFCCCSCFSFVCCQNCCCCCCFIFVCSFDCCGGGGGELLFFGFLLVVVVLFCFVCLFGWKNLNQNDFHRSEKNINHTESNTFYQTTIAFFIYFFSWLKLGI